MKKNMLLSILLFLAFIPMLSRADLVTDGARYGLLLWYHSVVPALFPFMVLSGFLVALGYAPMMMRPIHRLFHTIIPLTANGFYILFAGMLCGYPMGAKTCADFMDDGKISYQEGQFLMSICNHPSPMFLMGYVYPFFSEQYFVWELLFSVYGPLLILAPLARYIYFGKDRFENAIPKDDNSELNPKPEIYTQISIDETILSSVIVLCKIGGYLVLFSIIILFVRQLAWMPNSIRLFFIGAMEMTTGIREICASLQMPEAFVSSVASLVFGGCSGIFQTNSVIHRDYGRNSFHEQTTSSDFTNEKKTGLSIRSYILWKLLHTALAAGFACIVCKMH